LFLAIFSEQVVPSKGAPAIHNGTGCGPSDRRFGGPGETFCKKETQKRMKRIVVPVALNRPSKAIDISKALKQGRYGGRQDY
jgi:hypothetical protein